MYMETKGIEEMTREELIELVSSLNKDLESTKKDLELYKRLEKSRRSCQSVS